MAVLVLGASWYLVTALKAASNRTALNRAHNAEVLSLAKQALLGWAARNAIDDTDINPGRIPCPEAAGNAGDPANEGIMSGFCGAGTVVGRLPWRSLGLPKLRDAAGEPLWYIVSNGWKLNVGGATLGINANSAGQLALDGVANTVVALIIAPGAPLHMVPNSSQTAAGCAVRTQARGTLPPDYLDYLECQNIAGASTRSTVLDNVSNPIFNDQVVGVTAAEVLSAVEGPVAQRMRRDVVPHLQTLYASAEWGGSIAAPIYPFPARLRNDADTAFNPDNYRGQLYHNDSNTGPAPALTQGLLPLTASVCAPLTATRCDPNFVQWDIPTISATQTGGSATTFNANCATSTTSQVECSITYSRLLCLICAVSVTIRVEASAPNVAMSMKVFNAAGATGLTSLTVPLQPDGSARAIYTGTLTGGSSGICGSLLSVLCSGSATVRIPLSIFEDHPLVDPPSSHPAYWFTANGWQDVTYYAVAPSHLPSGASHDCPSVGDCIAIGGNSPSTSVRAALVLAGRSLQAIGGSNRLLSDFLDTAENRDLNQVFEQSRISRTFNDRFVSITP